MATKILPTEKDKPKSIGDKVIEIIHSITSGTGGEEKKDPVVPEIIKTMSEESVIGGGRRKRKIDDAEREAVGN